MNLLYALAKELIVVDVLVGCVVEGALDHRAEPTV